MQQVQSAFADMGVEFRLPLIGVAPLALGAAPDSSAMRYWYYFNTVTITDAANNGESYISDAFRNVRSVAQTDPVLQTPGALSRSATNPENGTVTYDYNGKNLLTSKTDAKGQTFSYSYDTYNRPVSVSRRRRCGSAITTATRLTAPIRFGERLGARWASSGSSLRRPIRRE